MIVAEPSAAGIFLVLLIAPGGEDAVRDALTDAGGLRRSVGFRIPEADLGCVVGIGSEAWDRLYPGLPRPAHLHPLPVYTGAVHAAPSTPGDLLLHIRAQRMDLCFELAQRITERFGPAVIVIDEVHGFRSFDERDLLGFVDGTENPEGDGAVDAVTVSDDEDPGSAAPAMSSSRSTCTTSPRGTRSRPRSRNGRSDARSCRTSRWPTTSSHPTRTSRST